MVSQERRLVLLRHAKSDWSTGHPDKQRPLAARGRRDAPAAGRWLRKHAGPIDLVVCSTADLGPGSGRIGPTATAAPIVAEVGYLLGVRAGPKAEAIFLHSLADNDFVPVELVTQDYPRMAELVEKYASLPLGASDASVISVAERLGITEIATLDHRHFTVVRPRHAPNLALLP